MIDCRIDFYIQLLSSVIFQLTIQAISLYNYAHCTCQAIAHSHMYLVAIIVTASRL